MSTKGDKSTVAHYKFLDSRFGYESFDGQVENGIFQKGILRYKNGAFYRGSFKNGKFEGKGIFQWQYGRRYEGFWKEGEHHGYGILCSDINQFLRTKNIGSKNDQESLPQIQDNSPTQKSNSNQLLEYLMLGNSV